jgi:Flp pilus assembly protein TadD
VALEAAVRARPEELSYWVDLGRAYVGKGDAQGAVRAFEQASLLAPKEARIQVYLGHAHELARDYDRAELCYRHAVTLEPKRAWPLRVLGARLLRFQRYTEAAEVLTRASELDAQHAETYNALAIALSKSGQVARAELTFRAAIARFPDERRFRLGLAALYANEGRRRDALAVYDAIAQRWPELAEVQVARSILLDELGDRAQAIAALKQAQRLAPHNEELKRRLAAAQAPDAGAEPAR